MLMVSVDVYEAVVICYLLLSFFLRLVISFFFFFNDTATTEIYTLSLHDALPISNGCHPALCVEGVTMLTKPRWEAEVRVMHSVFPKFEPCAEPGLWAGFRGALRRSEEHTSELQSQSNLVCRLLLEKKKKKTTISPLHQTNHYTQMIDILSHIAHSLLHVYTIGS